VLLWIGEWKRHSGPFKEQARPMEKEEIFGLSLYG
jgi:hypothetical protein